MTPKRTSPDQRHERIVGALESGVRRDLWERLGLTAPMSSDALVPWVFEEWRKQEVRGERLSLHIPAHAVPSTLPGWRSVVEEVGRPFFRSRVVAHVDRHDEPYAFLSERWVDVFAGVYFGDDVCMWLPVDRWDEGQAAGVTQPLALCALAATSVVKQTGCSAADATSFLLCGVRIPRPGTRCHFSLRGGMQLWVPDSDMTAEQLSAEYAQARKLAGLTPRSKGVSSHTGDMVRMVREMRPPATWSEVLARWNAERPEYAYADRDSLRRAYQSTMSVRRARGIVDGEPEEGR